MDWRQKTIQNVFGGNEKRFEKAYQEAVKEAISEAVSWKDLALNATVLPNLENQTKDLIERRLGYLPHPAVSLRYEPYLRALLQRHQQDSYRRKHSPTKPKRTFSSFAMPICSTTVHLNPLRTLYKVIKKCSESMAFKPKND